MLWSYVTAEGRQSRPWADYVEPWRLGSGWLVGGQKTQLLSGKKRERTKNYAWRGEECPRNVARGGGFIG